MTITMEEGPATPTDVIIAAPALQHREVMPKAAKKERLAKKESSIKEKAELSKEELAELKKCEKTILQGLTSSLDMGRALKQIDDQELHRRSFKRFEDYCEQHLRICRQHAYRQIKAAKTFDLLLSELQNEVQTSPKGDKDLNVLPQNESQIRPLVGLKQADQLTAVWKEAVKLAGEKQVTAKLVKEAVNKLIVAPPRKAKTVAIPVQESTDTLDKVYKMIQEARQKFKELGNPDVQDLLEQIAAEIKGQVPAPAEIKEIVPAQAVEGGTA